MTLSNLTRFGVTALVLFSLTACGGDNPVVTPAPTPTPTPTPSPTPSPVPTPTPTPTPGANAISSTVSSPVDVVGTLVAACFSESCDPATDGNSSGTQVTTNGSSAPYSVAVNAGQYVMIAIQDTNGSGAFDTEDYIGSYPSIEAPAAVTAPTSGIAITLVPYTAAARNEPAWLENARARLLNAE